MRALLVAALLAASAPALAQDDDRARELFENGSQLYEEGLYEEAILAWDEAYRLSKRPLLLYNIANALERLNRPAEAIDYLNRYRAYAPASERPTLERRMRALEARMKDLPEDPPDPPPEDPPVDDPPEDPIVTDPPPGRPVSAPAIALFAAGGAGLAVGGGFGVAALGARRDAREWCAGEPLVCRTEGQNALKRDKLFSALSDTGFAVGVLATGAGVAVALLTSSRRMERGVGWAPTPGGILIHGRY